MGEEHCAKFGKGPHELLNEKLKIENGELGGPNFYLHWFLSS